MSRKMEKHFVTFFSPGTFVAETTTKPIDSWDVSKALEMAKTITERWNSKPYGFQFFTKARTDDELYSHEIARSGIYYINGTIKTIEDLKAEHNPDNKILISNMECNGWDRVVQTRSPWEWTQPFDDNDHIVALEE